jgi:hypothetical protein
VLIVVLIIGGVYFTPTIVAFSRQVPNKGSVLVVNLLLGWTFIGWAVALAMAARSRWPTAYPGTPSQPTHPAQPPYWPPPEGQPSNPSKPQHWPPPPDDSAVPPPQTRQELSAPGLQADGDALAQDEAAEDTVDARCPNGHSGPDGAKFCPDCGAPLEPTRSPPPPSP